MPGLSDVICSFASFDSRTDAERYGTASAISETFASELMSAFRRAFAGDLRRHPAVWQSLRRLGTLSFPKCWHRSMERCRNALVSRNPEEAIAGAVELLIHDSEHIPKRVDLADRQLVVRVFDRGGYRDIKMAGFEVIAESDSMVLNIRNSEGGLRLPIARHAYDLTRRFPHRRWEPTIIGFEQGDHEDHKRLADAYSLLRSASPRAASWVRYTTRMLTIAAPPSKEVMISSSDFAKPGEIELSLSNEPAAVAETLIHECAHQYLHLAELLGALDNGTDDRLYYSPVKRENRPIRAILVAFHAFANVALFYEAVLSGHLPPRAKLYCALHRDKNLNNLSVLAGHLMSSPGLTEIGEGLWKPLYDRLRYRHLIAA